MILDDWVTMNWIKCLIKELNRNQTINGCKSDED